MKLTSCMMCEQFSDGTLGLCGVRGNQFWTKNWQVVRKTGMLLLVANTKTNHENIPKLMK